MPNSENSSVTSENQPIPETSNEKKKPPKPSCSRKRMRFWTNRASVRKIADLPPRARETEIMNEPRKGGRGFDAIKYSKLKPVLRFVLLVIGTCMDIENPIMRPRWVGVAQIMDMTGYGKTTVVDALKRLEEMGYINRFEERRGPHGHFYGRTVSLASKIEEEYQDRLREEIAECLPTKTMANQDRAAVPDECSDKKTENNQDRAAVPNHDRTAVPVGDRGSVPKHYVPKHDETKHNEFSRQPDSKATKPQKETQPPRRRGEKTTARNIFRRAIGCTNGNFKDVCRIDRESERCLEEFGLEAILLAEGEVEKQGFVGSCSVESFVGAVIVFSQQIQEQRK